MRKITNEAYIAFTDRKYFKSKNTRVCIDNYGEATLYLYDHLIAETVNGEVWITDAGFPTRTTHDRLRIFVNISTKKGIVILNGCREWDGSWINITRI